MTYCTQLIYYRVHLCYLRRDFLLERKGDWKGAGRGRARLFEEGGPSALQRRQIFAASRNDFAAILQMRVIGCPTSSPRPLSLGDALARPLPPSPEQLRSWRPAQPPYPDPIFRHHRVLTHVPRKLLRKRKAQRGPTACPPLTAKVTKKSIVITKPVPPPSSL